MALTQADLDRILGTRPTAQGIFDANQPTITNTPRSIVSGTWADILKPIVSNPVGEFVGAADMQRALDSASYGKPLTTGGSVQTGGFRPEYLAAALGLTPMGKGAKVAKKTTFETAQETARRNATLPVSEGGLGLPATNTAMDRAKAMGFDTNKTWYHGTDAKDFNSFNPMTYLSESPSEASAYGFVDNLINKERALSKYKINPSTKGHETFAPYSGILSDINSPEVGKLYATDNGVFKYRGEGKWDAMSKLDVDYDNYNPSTDSMKIVKSNKGEALNSVNENIAYANETFPRGVGGRVLPLFTSAKNPIELGAFDANIFGKRLGATDSDISNAISKYKNEGYDSINTLSDAASFFPDARLLLGGIPEQKIIFNPNQLRSPNAAFDPFRRNEADILAGVAAAPVGLLAVDKEKTKKK
jgi:hypothetical protein